MPFLTIGSAKRFSFIGIGHYLRHNEHGASPHTEAVRAARTP